MIKEIHSILAGIKEEFGREHVNVNGYILIRVDNDSDDYPISDRTPHRSIKDCFSGTCAIGIDRRLATVKSVVSSLETSNTKDRLVAIYSNGHLVRVYTKKLTDGERP